MGFARLATTAIVTALVASGAVDRVMAESPICTNLEAQLAALNRGNGARSAAGFREYDASVSRQRNEIRQATAEARRAGCVGGFLIFKPKPQRKCGALMATIERQKANLNRLIAARNRNGADPFALQQQRNQLLRALDANQCGTTVAGFGRGRSGGGFLETLFGGARFRKWGEDGFFSGSPYGTYRTLCVRTCDGYYFPISFSTTPSRFMSDAQSCQAICPGTNVALYTHRNPGEESESMVSLAGEPYTALPTAFRYRTEFDPACICGSVTAPATILNDDPQAGPLVVDLTVRPPAADGVPIPRKRPLATEDPETLANRAGELVPRPVVTARTEAVIQIDPSGRSIRVVGPSYYYGQQASAGE